MKKILLPLSIALMSAFAVSCGGNAEKKQVENTSNKGTELTQLKDELKFDSTKLYVGWTAFKTTDSVGVSGQFTDYTLAGIAEGETPEEIFEGSSISINTGSASTGNTVKDNNIINYFFGKFEYPDKIDVSVKSLSETEGVLEVTMNQITQEVSVTPSFADRAYSLQGTLNLEAFKVVPAADSLNYKCAKNHAGADGIVKLARTIHILVKAEL